MDAQTRVPYHHRPSSPTTDEEEEVASEAGAGTRGKKSSGPKQLEVPVEKGEDEQAYEGLGAKVSKSDSMGLLFFFGGGG